MERETLQALEIVVGSAAGVIVIVRTLAGFGQSVKENIIDATDCLHEEKEKRLITERKIANQVGLNNFIHDN